MELSCLRLKGGVFEVAFFDLPRVMVLTLLGCSISWSRSIPCLRREHLPKNALCHSNVSRCPSSNLTSLCFDSSPQAISTLVTSGPEMAFQKNESKSISVLQNSQLMGIQRPKLSD